MEKVKGLRGPVINLFTVNRMLPVCAFLIPVLIMIFLFIIQGIYPFGGRSFLVSDMYHQYMPFFSEFMRKVQEGESLGFSYNVGIGSNFLALFVYYLASPSHLLAFLFPAEHLMEFMTYLAVIKIGLCGLTAYIYLQKHYEDAGEESGGAYAIMALLCSSFYALSGYMMAYNWNIMWLDCVLLLPMLVLGLERLMRQNRPWLYYIMLSLCIFTNYYISIMVCIFLVLYFLFLFFTEKVNWKSVGQFVLFSILAGGTAAVLLVPEVCAILQTDFGDINFPEKLESYFSVLDILARHCMCISTERGLDHWPNIYCGCGVFVLLPLYVTNQKVPVRRRFGMVALACFLLVGFSTNMLNFIWHGLNWPDSLPARQSFIYVFLVLVICYEALRYIKDTEPRQIIHGVLAGTLFLLFCEKFVEHEDFEPGVILLSLFFAVLYGVLVYLYRTGVQEWKRYAVGVVALALTIVELAANTVNTTVGSTIRANYLDPIKDYKALYQVTQELEEGFYRTEKFSRKTKNDGTLAGFPTASVFSSTLNSYVMDMYKQMGMHYSKVYYGYDGATALTAAMLNVKYMFGEKDDYGNSLYTLLEKSGDVYLYEYEKCLPFGYVAPSGWDIAEGTASDGLRLQNRLVQELGVGGQLFAQVKKETKKSTIQFVAEDKGVYYGLVTSSGTKKISAEGDSMDGHTYIDLKVDRIIYLGELEAGEYITLKNGDDKDTTPEISVEFFKMNESVLDEALAVLSKYHMENVVYDSDHLTGTLHLGEPGKLIMSLPREEGYRLLLNGQETQWTTFGGALLAVELEAGDYEIELIYHPAGATEGLIVSILCIVIALILALLAFFARKTAKNTIGSNFEDMV